MGCWAVSGIAIDSAAPEGRPGGGSNQLSVTCSDEYTVLMRLRKKLYYANTLQILSTSEGMVGGSIDTIPKKLIVSQ
jgi:hypothetical protein